MTKLLWIALSIGIAILTVLAFTFFAPFHHTFLDIALIFSPLLIVFVALPATRNGHPRRPEPAQKFHLVAGRLVPVFPQRPGISCAR